MTTDRDSDFVDRKKIGTKLAEQAIDQLIKVGTNKIKEYLAVYRNRDITTYSDYLARKGIRFGRVRTLISDTGTEKFYDIYTPDTITFSPASSHNFSVLTGNDLISQICERTTERRQRPAMAINIEATAGAGKSMFMRHIFYRTQRIQTEMIPILIELRSLNNLDGAPIEQRISDEFERVGSNIMIEQIKHGLDAGLFILLFDGMDELSGKLQRYYKDEILRIVERYPQVPLVVAGRPALDASNRFLDTKQILPMSLPASVKLIMKLPADTQQKEKFSELLSIRLYETRTKFASVPLLCIIMFMTFSYSGRISERQVEFYEDAFQALWIRHDSRKDNFERTRYSGFGKAAFLKLLSAFAGAAYTENAYEFKDTSFSKYFEFATAFTSLKCDEENFKKDLVETTCLLTYDGPFLKFPHRSFQEYFAALFISSLDDKQMTSVIAAISDRMDTDAVLPLLLSISPEKVQSNWIIPNITYIITKLKPFVQDTDEYCKLLISLKDIQETMKRIRYIYNFSPNSLEITSHLNSFDKLKIKLNSLPNSHPDRTIFIQDMNNFEKLLDRLSKIYHTRSDAFRIFLSDQKT